MAARAMYITGVALVTAALAVLLAGLQYYVLPLAERPFSAVHDLFAPSGLVGQGLGIVGTAMMAFGVTAYGVRKRVRALHRFGKLADWLKVHVFLCLLGPFLILLHTSFKFGGIVSIAFWSMAVVVASGAFGRWVYVWIPKTADGRFLGRREVRGRLDEILRDLEAELGDLEAELGMTGAELLQLVIPSEVSARDRAPTSAGGRTARDRHRRRGWSAISGALADSVRHRLTRRRQRARLTASLEGAGVPDPIRSRLVASLEEERRIEQQLRMLEPFQAAFRYWHAFHLPLAAVMLLVLVVHVAVAIVFGYTWIWTP
jgi:hypothetical protein